jgi:hypothetical protein|tara:strand:- start:1367 stop:1624 length:258 start_codon:yes stop_codon:yes gene_type:complete
MDSQGNSEEATQSEIQNHEAPFTVYEANMPDWRIWFGVSLTAFWLIMLSAYITGTIGWTNIGRAPIERPAVSLKAHLLPWLFYGS